MTVIVADDHPLFRKGLTDLIGGTNRYSVIGEAAGGEDALRLVRNLRPDVALLDINMPGMDGIDAARAIMEEKSGTEVVILTMYEDEGHFELAMEAGVMGYLLKDSAAADIITCMDSVLSGRSYVSPSLSFHLMKRSVKAAKGIERKLGVDALTISERRILKLISESKSTREIAGQLFISVKTVSAHRSNICTKLGLHGTNSLLKFALEHKDLL